MAECLAASGETAQYEDREARKQQALACLRRHLRARSKWYDNSPGVLWAAYLLVFLCWCTLTLLNPHFTISPTQQSPTHPITGMLFAGLVPTLLCMLTLTGYGSALAARTDRLRDSLSVAAVFNALMEHVRNMEAQGEMFSSLTALLLHIEETDADDITPTATTHLLNLLRRQHAREPQFAVAALRALGYIGDAWAVSLVARLANQAEVTEVNEAAQECLGKIQARLGQKQSEAVLLRPSEDTQTVLLRPASERSEQDASCLLRPVHK